MWQGVRVLLATVRIQPKSWTLNVEYLHPLGGQVQVEIRRLHDWFPPKPVRAGRTWG